MRKYLLAAVAAAAVSTPAVARDNSPYIGIEGGVMFPRDNDVDLDVDFVTTNVTFPAGGVVPPNTPAGPADTRFDDAFGVDYKTGFDIDLIAGYDFGMFKLEGELGYKRAKADDVEIDSTDLAALNAALNRPSVAPDPGAPGLPALAGGSFDIDGTVKVFSAMLNGLIDFGPDDGLGGYVGGGAGWARAKAFGESDSGFAWQLIAGLRYALSPNIDLGLKYRYFSTGNLDFSDNDEFLVDGNPNRLTVTTPGGPVVVDQTTDAFVTTNAEQKFRSHSLLLSLVYNFGAVAEPLPPPPPPPPPPPAAPATQTCPDGSVILATSACPPPPPPPPPAPVERGERGR